MARQRQSNRFEILVYVVLRVAGGGLLIPHGIAQLIEGDQSLGAAALALIGIHPSASAGYSIVILELVGGIAVAIGLFTRIFAAALALEMGWVASMFLLHTSGQSPDAEFFPWDFPLTLTVVLLMIAIRGGGAWSLDQVLRETRREL